MEYEHRTRYEDPPPQPKHAAPPSPGKIVLTQKNPAALAAAHVVSKPSVLPSVLTSPSASFRFMQTNASAEIHEFLFQMTKGGATFWVGAAVPKGATDFTRAQVYFHPTVRQDKIAMRRRSYREFTGGWSGSMQRYISLQGVQLAAAHRNYPMIFPFTTMAALRRGGPNMFSDRPVETLKKIVDAIVDALPGSAAVPALSSIGAASFSSGIWALTLFLNQMRSSGMIKEVTDFDSPWITGAPKALTPSPGAVSRCFTRVRLGHEPRGYVSVNDDHFAAVTAPARKVSTRRLAGRCSVRQC